MIIKSNNQSTNQSLSSTNQKEEPTKACCKVKLLNKLRGPPPGQVPVSVDDTRM